MYILDAARFYKDRIVVNDLAQAERFVLAHDKNTPCFAIEHDVHIFLKRSGFDNCHVLEIDSNDLVDLLSSFEKDKDISGFDDHVFFSYMPQWIAKKYNTNELGRDHFKKNCSLIKATWSLFISKIDRIFTTHYFSRLDGLTLDFSSTSGQTQDRGAHHFNVRYIQSTDAKLSKSNIYRHVIKKKKEKYRYIVIYYDSAEYSPTENLSDAIDMELKKRRKFYEHTEHIIRSLSKSITSVIVNEGVSLRADAALRACHEHNIPTILKSHGGVVLGGNGERQYVSRLLSLNGFNSHPLAKKLQPRIQEQLFDIHKPFTIKKKFQRRQHQPRNKKFKILFAPNYHRFAAQVPSFSPTSFDVAAYAQALSLLTKECDYELGIRLKFSPTGNAKVENQSFHSVDRQLIEDLCKKDDVYAAEKEIYQELSNADLVITCGNTAITFDALEVGVPVAIILRDQAQHPFFAPFEVSMSEYDNPCRLPIYAHKNLSEQIRNLIADIRAHASAR